MSSSQSFLPPYPQGGRDRYESGAHKHYLRTLEHNQQEEVKLAAREEELKKTGPELAKQHGFKFIGTTREYPAGVAIPQDPRLRATGPLKSVIKLGFEVARANIAAWRVQERLADWVELGGKYSTGWNVWLREDELDKISSIFKQSSPDEWNRVQLDGTIVNFSGSYRVTGKTKNCALWVVCPDGSLREPDEHTGAGRFERWKDAEGWKKWDLVVLDELALSWSKSHTAAPHEFVVIKLPENGVTASQVAAVKAIQDDIAKRWSDTTGCSGRNSPDIGEGWGLTVGLSPETLRATSVE